MGMTTKRQPLADGHRVAVREAGDGSWGLVCVHGLGQSGLMWEGVITALPTGWSAYALDLPGFGDSDPSPTGYSIAAQARVVRAFIEQLPHERVVLAGNSLGGVVALQAALEPSPALRGLVLVATGSRARDPERGRAYREKLVSNPLDVEQQRRMARSFFFTGLAPDRLDRVAADVGKARHEAILEAMASVLDTDVTPELPRIGLPTLVVQGREDRGRPPEDGLDLIRGIPDARLVVLPAAGHTPMLDAPAEFQIHLNAMLEAWRRSDGASPA